MKKAGGKCYSTNAAFMNAAGNSLSLRAAGGGGAGGSGSGGSGGGGGSGGPSALAGYQRVGDMSKDCNVKTVQALLAQLRREWSDDGAEERRQSFGVVVDALARHLPDDAAAAAGDASPRVLVPGSGLGRLAFDLAAAGYAATGIEHSYFMLVPAQYVMSRLLAAGGAPQAKERAATEAPADGGGDGARHGALGALDPRLRPAPT